MTGECFTVSYTENMRRSGLWDLSWQRRSLMRNPLSLQMLSDGWRKALKRARLWWSLPEGKISYELKEQHRKSGFWEGFLQSLCDTAFRSSGSWGDHGDNRQVRWQDNSVVFPASGDRTFRNIRSTYNHLILAYYWAREKEAQNCWYLLFHASFLHDLIRGMFPQSWCVFRRRLFLMRESSAFSCLLLALFCRNTYRWSQIQEKPSLSVCGCGRSGRHICFPSDIQHRTVI